MDIGLSAVFELGALSRAFARILPGLEVAIIEDVSELPESWDLWILVIEGSDEFPTGLMMAVPFVEGTDEELWLRDVARALSDEFGVQSLFDGTPFGPYESPYWSLIWNDGVPYLADDSEWEPGEEDSGELRIVEPLDLELFPRRSPEELAACVDRDFQILQRPEALRKLAVEQLSRMTTRERREQLEVTTRESWDTEPDWSELPQEVQKEFEDGVLLESPDSERYDPVLLIWLRFELGTGTNEYLAAEVHERLGHRAKVVGDEPELAACPCCGHASLTAPSEFDICRICWWEDDGQDNSRADLGMGGPNGRISLTQARANFLRYGLYDLKRTDLMELREPRRKYRQTRHFELSEDDSTVQEPESGWSSGAFRF